METLQEVTPIGEDEIIPIDKDQVKVEVAKDEDETVCCIDAATDQDIAAINSMHAHASEKKVSQSEKTALKTQVRGMSMYDIEEVDKNQALGEAAEKEFSKVVFADQRWDNGIKHLRAMEGWSRDKAKAILRQGARAFGCWHLSEQSLDGLADRLMEEAPKPSPGLQTWLRNHADGSNLATKELGNLAERELGVNPGLTNKDVQKMIKEKQKQATQEWTAHMIPKNSVKKMKIAVNSLVFVISFAYACKVVWQMYADAGIIELLGWPVFFARMGGMACAIWTAILYASMSRSFVTTIGIALPNWPNFNAILDMHKELHVMAGWGMLATGFEHTVAHAIGTVPGLLKSDLEKINRLLGCANPNDTPGYINLPMRALQWPKCPLEEKPRDFSHALFLTMPGVTGLVLLLLLSTVAWTGKDINRKNNFDRFIYLHNFLVWIWPIALFLHGSQGWIGVGFPLVVFTTSLPFLGYVYDRFMRAMRYFFFAGSAVQIVSAVVRPGKKESFDGALSYVQISPPSMFWRFRPGMYAFICMPEYRFAQWHPFTICSGSEDPTVNFLIAGVGDWTKELAKRCSEAKKGGKLPKVAIDGPYRAPTQSALSKQVLVAVGAGVGITPFLSLMSTIISVMAKPRRREVPLKEAHFFWMTRSIDEFLFGRDLFTQIVLKSRLRDKVFLHLHCSASEPKDDASAFMFREALKRQTKNDLKAFDEVFGKVLDKGAALLTGPELPWCWVNGSKQDVLWVSHLVKMDNASENSAFLEGCDAEAWAATMMMSKEEEEKKVEEAHKSCTVGKVFKPAASKESIERNREDSLQSIENGEAKTEVVLPIVFGRPDFAAEVRAIGKARPSCDVDVYICGNDAVVKGLEDVCEVCNDLSYNEWQSKDCKGRLQQYNVHFERFG